MIALLCSHDESSNIKAQEICFIHVNSCKKSDIKIECAPMALKFARQLNLKKVFLFYGSKGKIIYDYPL